jgi:hypothetical protein
MLNWVGMGADVVRVGVLSQTPVPAMPVLPRRGDQIREPVEELKR